MSPNRSPSRCLSSWSVLPGGDKQLEHMWSTESQGRRPVPCWVAAEHLPRQMIHALQVTIMEFSNSKIASAPRWQLSQHFGYSRCTPFCLHFPATSIWKVQMHWPRVWLGKVIALLNWKL